MEYSYELFTTEKFPSTITQYRYQISGAFYDVYSNGPGDYHMAIEDKASIEERIYFLEHDIIKNGRYPIYDNRYGILSEANAADNLLTQVLGLPDEVLRKSLPDGTLGEFLRPSEIVSRIHFEKDLFRGYGNPKITQQILNTDSYCVIGAINDLIAHGLFVQNPDRIYHLDTLNESYYYPVYVDEKKIPEAWLKEKETSDKLVMDFVDDVFDLTKDDFLHYFKPLDSLSLSELCAYGFDRHLPEHMPVGEVKSRLAVRRYFLALVKEELNVFFERQYHVINLFGHTVLRHDFKVHPFPSRFAYLGQNFSMFSKDCKRIEKDGDQVVEKCWQEYQIDRKSLPRIKVAFQGTQRYFLRHPELGFIPSYFLRTMGMPYPAFEQTKYFDFEKGNADEFVSLLSKGKDIDLKKQGLILPLLLANGNELSSASWPSYVPFYLQWDHMEDIFFSNAIGLFYDYSQAPVLLIYIGDKNIRFKKLLTGDSSVYRQTMDFLEKRAFEIYSDTSHLEEAKAFLVKDEHDGVLTTYAKFFDLLKKGYSTKEAYDSLKDSFHFSYQACMVLFISALGMYYNNEAIDFFKTYCLRQYKNDNYVDGKNEFYDETLPYPHVYQGNNFLAYKKDGEDTIYLDSKDKKAIENLLKIFNDTFARHHHYSYVIALSGNEFLRNHHFDSKDKTHFLVEYMGLPSALKWNGDISQLHFLPNISLFRKDHLDILKEDESLKNAFLFSEAAQEGVYALGFKEGARPLCHTDNIKESLKYYLYFPVVKEFLINNQRLSAPEKKDGFVENQFTEIKFKKSFEPFLNGSKAADSNNSLATMATNYAGNVLKAYLDTLEGRLNPKDTESKDCLLFYPHEKEYVAVGPTFFAYASQAKISSFALEARDIPLIVDAINVSKELSKDPMDIAYRSGLPVLFHKRIMTLVRKKPKVTKLDIIRSFPIQEEHQDTCLLYSYLDPISVTKPLFDSSFTSSQLFHEAMAEGMYIFPDTDLMEEKMIDEDFLSEILSFSSLALVSKPIVLFPQRLKGSVREIFIPDDISFGILVDGFIQKYTQTNLSPDFLFFAKEGLEYLHLKDEHCFIKSVNLLQWHGDYMGMEKQVHHLLKGFSLEGMGEKISEEEFVSFYCLFLLYLEQQILLRLVKKIKQEL